MNFIKLICLGVIAVILTSCDTFYRAFLVNSTNENVTVIANVELNFGNPNLLSLVEIENGRFVHELIPNSEYVLVAGIDMPLVADLFPCDTLVIISNADTISYTSKEEIMNAMEVITDERMELRID